MVVGAWFAVSRRGTPRLVALGTTVAALVLFAWVMVASSSVRVLVVGVLLAAVSAGAARVALRPPSVDPSQVPSAPRARHAVLIMNPWSGGGKVERFELERLCRERGIEPIVLYKGSDLLALAEDAVARGCRRHRHGRGRRFSGARGVGGEPARHPDGGGPGGHAKPLRPRPRGRPGGCRRRARRLRGRVRPTDRPRGGQRTHLRQQLVDGALREGRAVRRVPRRQGAHRGRHAARPPRPERRAPGPALHAAVR